jgi:hypothetical protein
MPKTGLNRATWWVVIVIVLVAVISAMLRTV